MSSGASFLRALQSRLGLETKFVLLASLVLIVGSSIANRLVFSYEQRERLLTTEEKGRLLVESMGISFTHTLLYEEIGLVEESGLLDSFIQNILKTRELDVRSVVVFDPQGRIIAHNDYREYGKTYGDDHTRRILASRKTLVHRSEVDGANLLDIATPLQIGSRRWGTLRLMISLDSVAAELHDFANHLVLLTVASVLVGIVIALAVARALAYPIKQLTATMQAVGADFQTDFKADRSDEIGRLQRSFLEMLARLRRTAQAQARMQRMLIHTERLASIGTLASGVAHEINNPLAGLRSCLQRIQKRPEDGTQTRQYGTLMMQAVDQIGAVVKGMLDFARRGGGAEQRLCMAEVLQETVGLIEYRLQQHRIELEMAVDAGLPDIRGDRGRIGQVFLNLMLNAIDAMPEGGRLSLRCELREGDLVTRVQDTGTGIPEAQINRIFDPFYTTKEVGKGTGLGLAIAHGILEEHGGRIDVESRVGAGTEFVVHLPVAGPSDAPNTAEKRET